MGRPRVELRAEESGRSPHLACHLGQGTASQPSVFSSEIRVDINLLWWRYGFQEIMEIIGR